jgi:hypothetical protein
MKFEFMDSLRRVIATTFSIKQAKSENGVYGPSRKCVTELNQISLDTTVFQGLESKQRRKGRLIAALKHCIWYELEEWDHPMEVDGKLIYFYDDTEGSNRDRLKPTDADAEKCFACVVSEMEIIDDTDEKHKNKSIIFVTTDGRVVAYKLSRRERGRITLKKWRNHVKALRLALEVQRNNPRGIRRAGLYAKYVLFGFRREGNSKRVSKYVAKKGAKECKIADASTGLQNLVSDLEDTGLNLVSHLEISVQNKLREEYEMGKVMINGYRGRFSQMAIATNYWSPLHVDDDFFRTLLSCYDESKMTTKKKEDILFYFVFPSLNIAIPMRSTDILVFDAKFPHCASNYRSEDSMIFSCFTSAKTGNAHMTNVMKANATK